MAYIYRRKNASLYYNYRCGTKKHSFPSVQFDHDIEDKFHVLLKQSIKDMKHELRRVLSEMNTSYAVYEGPLCKGTCVRDFNVMGFGCSTTSFIDPLLQIANHIHASCWEPRDDQDGHTILYELRTYLMQVLILQECGRVLHNFKENDGCVVVNLYEERFKLALSHFKSWFTLKNESVFLYLFSAEEYFVLSHAYISHRRKTLFDLNYKFPNTLHSHSQFHFTEILLWRGDDVEKRDIEWMQTTVDWRWGGYIKEKFYADELKDGCYSFPSKMKKNYRVGLKEDCIVVKVLPNEKNLVWWYAYNVCGGKHIPCSNCRAYSKSMGMDMWEFRSSEIRNRKYPRRAMAYIKKRKKQKCDCYCALSIKQLLDFYFLS